MDLTLSYKRSKNSLSVNRINRIIQYYCDIVSLFHFFLKPIHSFSHEILDDERFRTRASRLSLFV